MTTTRRRFLTTTLSAGVLASLAACAQDLPTVPARTASPSPHPALDAERLSTVLSRVRTGLGKADESRQAEDLEGFLSGPAARVRAEEYALASATGDDASIHAVPLSVQAGAVGLTRDFPRTAMVVTEVDQDGSAQYLLTLTQDSARAPFSLWSWVRLFAGVEIPETSTPSVGSAQVGADATGLVATPEEVLASYVKALNEPDSEEGKAFADDALRQRIAAERGVDLSDMGTVTVTAQPGQDGIVGLRTASGGALVSATITFTTVYARTKAGSTVKVSGAVEALGGNAEVTGTVTASYDVMVAFTIPDAKSGGKPVALGTDLVLASVERDDSKAPAEE